MYQERMFEFFSNLGSDNSVPPVPTGNRPFVQLQDSPAVWAMSLEERQRLAEHWEEEMRQTCIPQLPWRVQDVTRAVRGGVRTVRGRLRRSKGPVYLRMLPALMFLTEEASFVERC
jgi:hypothetical protein